MKLLKYQLAFITPYFKPITREMNKLFVRRFDLKY